MGTSAFNTTVARSDITGRRKVWLGVEGVAALPVPAPPHQHSPPSSCSRDNATKPHKVWESVRADSLIIVIQTLYSQALVQDQRPYSLLDIVQGDEVAAPPGEQIRLFVQCPLPF